MRIGARRLTIISSCGLVLSILGLMVAFLMSLAQASHNFDRASISEQQLAAVSRIEALINRGGDASALGPLLMDYRRSITQEMTLLDGSDTSRRAENLEQARAARLIALAGAAASPARNAALHRLVNAISAGERQEANHVARRMAVLRVRTTVLAVLLTALAGLCALLGGAGLYAANRRLTDQVSARTSQLAAVDRSRRLFFAKVSHELRTPVTVMRGEAEVALADRRSGPDHLREALGHVIANTEFLQHRIEELLSLAQAEDGQITLRDGPVRMDLVMARVRDAAQAYAASSGVALTMTLPADDLAVRGDARWLEQAFLAVLDNAVKFSPAEGVVALVMTVGAESLLVEISDQGPGIVESQLPRIFDAYYQAEEGRVRGGTGLGLALARWVVEQHGGAIRARNEAGGGCTVAITLPRSLLPLPRAR